MGTHVTPQSENWAVHFDQNVPPVPGAIKTAHGWEIPLKGSDPTKAMGPAGDYAYLHTGALPQAVTFNALGYASGANMDVSVVFNEAITVTGTPQVTVVIGTNTRLASYVSGSGTNTLLFRYAIVSGDFALAGGVTIGNSGNIGLNSGTLRNADNVAAQLALPAATGIATIQVGAATASTLAFDKTTYITGNVLALTATFNEAITVTGVPQITISVNGTNRLASYVSGSGTTALVFNYTVVSGDSATATHVSIGNSGNIGLNSGTLKNATGVSASVAVPNPTNINSVTFN
jgi:hypothetical protein